MYAIKFQMPVLLVKDISISKKFYQEIFSLEIENDFGANIVFKNAFSIWEVNRAEEIIFKSQRIPDLNDKKYLELYFESNKIEEISKIIQEKSIEIIHGLKEEPWGQKTIRFFDPDNFIIEIAEPIERVVSRLSNSGLSHEEISIKTQLPLENVKEILK